MRKLYIALVAIACLGLAVILFLGIIPTIQNATTPASGEPTENKQQNTVSLFPDSKTGSSTSSTAGGASGSGGGGGGSTGGGTDSISGGSSGSGQDQSSRTFCTPESKNIIVDQCPKEDTPVCGWYDPQSGCESSNCIRSNFPNECEACATENILYWTPGDCPIHS